MKEQIISAVLEKMARHLNKEQGNILEWTLGVVLDDYRVEKTSHEVIVQKTQSSHTGFTCRN